MHPVHKRRFLFAYFFFVIALVSCAGVQTRNEVGHSVVSSKPTSTTQSARSPQALLNAPTADSYYHTLLGLQVEQERPLGSAIDNDREALGEYMAALSHDPKSGFLLEKISVLNYRIGNQKEALLYAKRARRLYPEDEKILILLGDVYLASGNPEKGLTAYGEALQLAPEKSPIFFKMAGLYASQKDFEMAEKVIRKGIEQGPLSPIGFYFLGRLAVEKKNLSEGIKFYQKALSINSAYEPAYIGIARVYEIQGRDQEAVEVYQHILMRVNSGNPEAGARLIQLLKRNKQYDAALELLGRLSRNSPGNLDISLQRALILAEKRDFSGAIKMLLPVLEGRPEDLRLYLYLSTLYEENKEIERAIATLRTVLDKDPDAYDIHIRLASLLFYKLQKVEKALFESSRARKIDPARPEAYLFSGLILQNEKRYSEASEVLLEGIAVNPSVTDLHFQLGAVFDKLNRFDEMVQSMKKTIELDPKHANALNYLGYTYAEKGIRLDEAVDLIHRALAVRPTDGYFIDSLGWALYKKGEFQEALTLLQKAVSLVPEDPVVHEHLGEIYLKNNQIDEARDAWRRSIELDPKNDKLIIRFNEAGFEARLQKKLPQLQLIVKIPSVSFPEGFSH